MVQLEQDDTFRSVLTEFVGTFLDQAGDILIDKYDEYIDYSVSFAGRNVSLLVFDEDWESEGSEPPVVVYFNLTSFRATIAVWREAQGEWEQIRGVKDFRDSDLFFDQTASASSQTIAFCVEKVLKGQKL